MKTVKNKVMAAGLALSILASQTGSIIGSALLVTPASIASIPLIGSGIALTVAGSVGLLTPGLVTRNSGMWGSGIGLIMIGALLDAPNGGHDDSLNPLPMDEQLASKLGVSLDDIESYNDNLNQVQRVAMDLQSDLRSQIQRGDIQNATAEDLKSDAQIDSLARKYGFQDAVQFLDALKADRLSKDRLEAFSTATGLDAAQAKILLSYGFAIHVE